MILATQSLKELEESSMLQIVAESCPTKVFLANPAMDRELYREAFHLNDTELDLIDGLVTARPDADPEGAVEQEGAAQC
jgi:type IV secretory pathway VirB4 component